MKLTQKTNLVMIGDSITDCGRARPVGEGPDGALGDGYVSLVASLFGAAHPNLGVCVVNTGIGGNTVRDLAARWQTDVLDLKPDWLSIMIGTNDVWRQFDNPARPESHVYLDEYERTLDALVARTRPTVSGLVLMTPFYVQPNQTDPMRAQMDRYGAVVMAIAARYNTLFVDTQAAFDAVLAFAPASALAPDRVHPTQTGHMVLARAFLYAVGFEW